MIKCKYDWSAVEHCLWDGLWLCQELAAKSIDPDAIAVCTTNTQGFMYLSHLGAADNLLELTYSSWKWNAYHHIYVFSLVWAFWHMQLVTRSLLSWMSHLLKQRKPHWRKKKKKLNARWCCPGIHSWPLSIAARVQLEQNFNNAVCSELSNDF